MEIARRGMTREAIFDQLADFRKNDIKWQEGRTYGYIFDPGKDVLAVGKAAYTDFLSENGLDFTVFQSLLRLERELAAFGASHLRGDSQVVGNFTSGGTESIILAVKAARDRYRERRPDIRVPEMILPATAHAAFHKAAHYLGVKVVTVSVDRIPSGRCGSGESRHYRQHHHDRGIGAILRPWSRGSDCRTGRAGTGA
jgi:sphinganine-1-phosphate aldolase